MPSAIGEAYRLGGSTLGKLSGTFKPIWTGRLRVRARVLGN